MGSDVPEHVGDKRRIDECQCLRFVLAYLRITTFTLVRKASKANYVTSLSSNSLKVLLTPTGTSVINLRRRNAEACIQNHSVRRSRCYFQ